jgi:hypothetical protein
MGCQMVKTRTRQLLALTGYDRNTDANTDPYIYDISIRWTHDLDIAKYTQHIILK